MNNLLKKIAPNHYNLVILDNFGATYDRYTILLSNGEMWGSSNEPFSPLGFGQCCGNVADLHWMTAYGSNWRNRLPVRKATNEALSNYLADCSNVGQPVPFESLPNDVKTYALQVSKYP